MNWEQHHAKARSPAVQRGMTLVGAAIRRRRSRARLSQWELARLVGIDQSTISRVEGGDRGLRWSTFAKLVEQLGGLDFHD